MASESKRKLLHYRKAEFLNNPGRPLQQLIQQAVTRLSPISHRKEGLTDNSEGETWVRFINTHRSALGMEFGVVVLLTPGQNKLIIGTDDHQDEVDVSQLPPPDDREYLESVLYYGIKDNHVIVLQSISMKARELENHFNWLLREASVISEENGVYLNNHAPDEIYEEITKSEVKSIRIGTPVIEQSTEIVPVGETTPRTNQLATRSMKFRHQGIGLDILSRLLPAHRLDNIDFGAMDPTSNVEVFVEVRYKRQTDHGSQRALNALASELRHVSEDDIRVEIKGVGTITGSQLVINTYKSFTSYGGKLEVQDVFTQMQTWLEELLSKSMIRGE